MEERFFLTGRSSWPVRFFGTFIAGSGAAFARVLESEYEQFFCRYSDPSYVKSVKLEILTAITAEVRCALVANNPHGS